MKNYPVRTEQNVIDSDGTAIFSIKPLLSRLEEHGRICPQTDGWPDEAFQEVLHRHLPDKTCGRHDRSQRIERIQSLPPEDTRVILTEHAIWELFLFRLAV